MDKAPNGIWSSFPALLAVMAWMFSLSSTCVCSFVNRTVTLVEDMKEGDSENTSIEGLNVQLLKNQGIGYWAWQSEGTCYSYTINGRSPSMDTAFQATSTLSTLTVLFGGIIVVCLMLGTVFPVVPKHYQYLGYASCIMSILSFSTLAITGSNVCAPGFFQYSLDEDMPLLKNITKSSCGVGLGSTFSILAGVVWILVGVICIKSPLGVSSREPGAYRGLHKDGGYGEDNDGMDGDGDAEANRLHRQRQAENEERYRKLMGELDDGDGPNPGFASINTQQQRLSLVEEEDGGEESGPFRMENGNRRHSDPRQQEQFDDEHSEGRSQYSDEELPQNESGDAGLPQLSHFRAVDARASPHSIQSGPNEVSRDDVHDDDDDDSYSDDDEYDNGYRRNDQRSLTGDSDLV